MEIACAFTPSAPQGHVSGPQQPRVARRGRPPPQLGARLPRGLGRARRGHSLRDFPQRWPPRGPLAVCVDQGQLLSIAAAYGDLETVRYLLTERQVELPTEPTDDNPAVVAAHFGHTEVVQELLESFRGKSQDMNSSPPLGGPSSLGIRQAWGGDCTPKGLFLLTFTHVELRCSHCRRLCAFL